MSVSTNELVPMFERMWMIRAFEEAVAEIYRKGQARGSAHACIGQEASAVGACWPLRKDDYVVSNHRGHGHCIAKGMDVKRMMAEIMARETGYCRGKGGSMHVADVSLGVLGANGIVGAGLPIAVGAGLAIRLRGSDQAALAFFGDGAANTGSFHESLNLAAVEKLPVVYICENNGWGLNMAADRALSVEHVADRAVAYGIPGLMVDGNDVMAVYEAVGEAVSRARKGRGPTLVECKTYRWLKHSIMTPVDVRPAEEIEEWKHRDPLMRTRHVLSDRGMLSDAELDAVEAKAREAIREAVAFALASPAPVAAQAYEDIYA
ncbi:MAG: thiamine pyrophosphate-dependent dehydrogenase E1 component subunit alpha [Chloroflexota bacterium]